MKKTLRSTAAALSTLRSLSQPGGCGGCLTHSHSTPALGRETSHLAAVVSHAFVTLLSSLLVQRSAVSPLPLLTLTSLLGTPREKETSFFSVSVVVSFFSFALILSLSLSLRPRQMTSMIHVAKGIPLWRDGPPHAQMDTQEQPGSEGIAIGFPLQPAASSYYPLSRAVVVLPLTLWDNTQVVHVIQMVNPDGQPVVADRYPQCGCPCAKYHTTMCGLIPAREMKQLPPALVGVVSQHEWAGWCRQVNGARHANWPIGCASLGFLFSLAPALCYKCYTDSQRRTVYRQGWEKLAERGLIWQRWFPEYAMLRGRRGGYKTGLSEQLRLVYSPYWHRQYAEFVAGRGPPPPVTRVAEEFWADSKEVGMPPYPCC